MSYRTKEQLLKLGEIDPEFEEVSYSPCSHSGDLIQKQTLKSMEMPPVQYDDLHAFIEFANARQDQMKAVLGDPPESVKQSEINYPAEDGTQMRAKLYQPAYPPANGSPLVVLFHGGGFCIGGPEGEEQTARALVQAYGATCVSASYRLAPRFRFPYAVNDAWDALKWSAANAKALGADPSVGFIVGGTSAGGNISAVLAHHARDQGLSPPLTGQYLAIPAVCPEKKMPQKYHDRFFSYEQNRNAPVLPQAAIDMFMGGYQADEDDAVNCKCPIQDRKRLQTRGETQLMRFLYSYCFQPSQRPCQPPSRIFSNRWNGSSEG